MRIIQHPDVEVNEIDLSQYNPAIAGTTSLIIGFADKGEDYLPLEFTSRNSWLQYYGKPTNEAERYLYAGATESISQNGRTIVAKLPYSNAVSGQYNAQTFDVATSSVALPSGAVDSAYANYTVSSTVAITSDGSSVVTIGELDSYRTGSSMVPVNKFEVVDITRQTLGKDNQSNEVVGTYVVINTAYNALPVQDMLEDSSSITDWYSVSSAQTSADVSVTDVVSPYFTSSITGDSLSKTTAGLFPSISLTDTGDLDYEYLHQISVSVVQMYVDSNNNNKINTSIIETFVGSLNRSAINPNTGESIFIQTIVNNNSRYINLFSNVTTLPTSTSIYKASAVIAEVFGFTEAQMAKTITVTGITTGMDVIFSKLDNTEATEIDQVVDGGLTSIAQYLNSTGDDSVYDPSSTSASAWTITDRDSLSYWRSVAGKFITFCQNTRRDCMVILDAPRNLALTGEQPIVRTSAPTNSVDVDVLPKLKYMTGLNSSYASLYSVWFRKLDDFSGLNFWCPPSIIANGIYIYNDRVSNYWNAPAGYNRGIVYNTNAISFNPNGKQQDSIFTKGFNYAINTPFDGTILSGDKTLQTKPSAFDSINVRRMFLRLERATARASKYYLYEGNNQFTRQRFVDQITPLFSDVQIRGGIDTFRIVCDTSNNTAEVIDRNEMICSILIKPVKAIRYIILNFVATSQGVKLEEVII